MEGLANRQSTRMATKTDARKAALQLYLGGAARLSKNKRRKEHAWQNKKKHNDTRLKRNQLSCKNRNTTKLSPT